ncbi:hypothetical protein JDV02_006046 [Purpureocillium takamizusanense]|uniref:Uncharacterized protein n=1 Tax=Purpureocillium takamizusanense TaxID=2060973 RepID=A0A9Q8QHM8_9HYPO|nr:uncharacterized protein JDV02_006046 [Purpureocillium takamizusanense]UNI19903.1 hypothetical protein JDV02_006046 [Purpureocillium takamizusanense]
MGRTLQSTHASHHLPPLLGDLPTTTCTTMYVDGAPYSPPLPLFPLPSSPSSILSFFADNDLASSFLSLSSSHQTKSLRLLYIHFNLFALEYPLLDSHPQEPHSSLAIAAHHNTSRRAAELIVRLTHTPDLICLFLSFHSLTVGKLVLPF